MIVSEYNRSGFFDFIKGLAIIGVMTIHMVGFSASGIPMLLLRQMCCVAVPLFFFISGYFTVKSIGEVEHWGKWVKRRFLRLWQPYLFWTILVVAVFRPGDLLSFETFVWRDIVLGYGIGIGYYVVALSQLTVLTPCLVRLIGSRPKTVFGISVCSTILGMAVVMGAAMKAIPTFGLAVPVPFPMVLFPVWLFPYVLGILFRLNDTKIRAFVLKVHRRFLVIVVGMLFLAMYLESLLWTRWPVVGISEHRISAWLFFVSVVVLVFRVESPRLHFPPVDMLGRACFFIYLTHLKAFHALRHIEGNAFFWGAIPSAGTPGGYLLRMTFVFLGFNALIYIGERMIPKKALKFVGIS